MPSLEQFTQTVVRRMISEQLPHLAHAAITRAEITAAKEPDAAAWYEYTVKLVDRCGNALSDWPEIPGVRSKAQYAAGSIVAIGFLDGEPEPIIISEVDL